MIFYQSLLLSTTVLNDICYIFVPNTNYRPVSIITYFHEVRIEVCKGFNIQQFKELKIVLY